MVSNAGPDDAVQVTSLEWRRHFYRVGSGPALVGCVVASLIAIIGFTGAVLAAAQWDSHNAVVLIWAGTGLFGSGMAASLIFQSQILPPAMNTVSISNGVTVVRSAGGRDLRRTMRRSEVWLPWERGVHAALYPVAPATSDNPGAPEILAPDTAPAPVPATEDTAVPGSADTTLG